MSSKSSALTPERGGLVAAEGRGAPGLHKRKCHPPLNPTHSKVGPQQLAWMAQLDFPSGKGAEDSFWTNISSALGNLSGDNCCRGQSAGHRR